MEGHEHVGEGWRALQDMSKVKLKVSCSLSLCDACICMTIVRPHTSSIAARDKPRFRSLESLQFGSAKRSLGPRRWRRYYGDGSQEVKLVFCSNPPPISQDQRNLHRVLACTRYETRKKHA